MGHLHQVLAVEKETESKAAQALASVRNVFQGRDHNFMGQIQVTEFIDESRAEHENTSTQKDVACTVDGILNRLVEDYAPVIDMVLQRDSANQKACGTLEFGNATFSNLPATFLLNLAKRLESVRGAILGAPTLDPSEEWEQDNNHEQGVWKCSREKTTVRTEKRPDSILTAPATDRHPAQVEVFNRDVAVARIRTTQFSGAWTEQRKREVLNRIDQLILVVKKAREDANQQEVNGAHIANEIFEWILKG